MTDYSQYSEHTILFALTVTSKAPMTREDAEGFAAALMPRPGTERFLRLGPSQKAMLDSWWVPEDDRHDGSDNDSAVYVHPGFQKAAYDLLRRHEMTNDCNDPAPWSPGGFEGPGDGRGLYVTEVPDDHPAYLVAMSNVPDGTRLPNRDVPCRWCGEFVMDEYACPNSKDICTDCCGED